jgi:hypothetical protein
MKRILFLLFIVNSSVFAQNNLTRNQRLKNYYETLSLYQSIIQDLKSKGINPFQPDYSQDGGGLPFQAFQAARANLEAEANALGLNTIIQDGWYQATIKYSNSNTTTNSEYILNVEIIDRRVVTIDFEQGRKIHSGNNNHGYIYLGGEVEKINGVFVGIVNVVTDTSVSTYVITLHTI